MIIVTDDKLNQYVNDISPDLLEKIFDINILDYDWTYSEDKEEPFIELEKIGKSMSHDKVNDDTEISLIICQGDHIYFYYFVVCPLQKLYHIISKSLQLKSFI